MKIVTRHFIYVWLLCSLLRSFLDLSWTYIVDKGHRTEAFGLSTSPYFKPAEILKLMSGKRKITKCTFMEWVSSPLYVFQPLFSWPLMQSDRSGIGHWKCGHILPNKLRKGHKPVESGRPVIKVYVSPTFTYFLYFPRHSGHIETP